MAHFDVYTITRCPYCTAAKGWMIANGHTLTEHNVQTNPEEKAKLESLIGPVRTAPQIFLGDYHIGGHDDLMEANQNGSLKMLIETQNP